MPVRYKAKVLAPGSTFAVVSPASPIDPVLMEKGLDLVRARGYKFKLMPHVLDSQAHLAGSDKDRAADLMAAFQDPEVDAVFCSRGGYGCARLFPYLDLDLMARSGKVLMGFSDITSLHLALNRRGAVSYHTPMALTLAYDRQPWVYESFFNLLLGNTTAPQDSLKAECVIPGKVQGEVIGGCMCLLCDSIGTPEELDTEGKIFVIEDVEEFPHRVDAMMTHLLNSGKLQQCAGILIGEMTRTDEKIDPTIGGSGWREIVIERLLQAKIPCAINFPFGHMSTMLSLPFGIQAELDTEKGTLTYLESPCEN